jgi:two-component system OmpR family response regulator
MLKVLIADDEQPILQLLETNLGLEGYETRTACNGREALEAIKSFGPNVVLLDVMMPVMDGWEVLRYVTGAKLDVRVILVTAKVHEDDRLMGWGLGCDGYITKPFDLDELLARVADVAAADATTAAARRSAALRELSALGR